MLKQVRVAVSVALFALVTFYFIDFAGLMSENTTDLTAKIQLIPAAMAASVFTLVALAALTLLFGRAYCSSICPLGIFQDVVAWVSKQAAPKKRYKFSKAKNILRLSMLAAAVAAVFLKFPLVVGLIDPYSAYGRIAANIFRPVYKSGNNALAEIFTSFGNYTFYKTDVFIISMPSLAVAALTMLAVGYLAWRNGRTYCNTICPVGTVLGLLSRFSVFKVRMDEGKCNSCGACEIRCKTACINSQQKTVDSSRCVDCFSCLDVCRRNALHFAPPPVRSKSADTAATKALVDEGKRRFLKAGAAAVAAVPVAAIKSEASSLTGSRKKYARQQPVLPPGAISTENMLKRCTSCHLCISKCPSRVLKPAFMEYGLAGMMQPTAHFEKGFCSLSCTVCSEVCPSGAIRRLTKEEKRHTQSGYAVFTRNICTVITSEASCGVCSEHCPTQAISMIPHKNGLTVPYVNVNACVGCGACEFSCPARPLRAIHVEGREVQGSTLNS
ncbi:MAG: 4Fe-4S binding protein [Prevotellaceae bacterium]|jgi:polyferredoxin|nr:4Fe-4S binding protein [Prevotellaceae bacterium]